MALGQLVQEVLDKVRSEQMTKLGQHEIIKTAEIKPRGSTELTALMCKLAESLKQESDDVSVADLNAFVRSLG